MRAARHARQGQQARHGLVGEGDAGHEQVVLLGYDVLARRVGRVDVGRAVALEHGEAPAALAGDALNVGEVAHHAHVAAGHLGRVLGEGVGAALVSVGLLALVVIGGAERVEQLAARVPGVERGHAQGGLLEVPRLGQPRQLAKAAPPQRGLARAPRPRPARAGHGDSHAALGLHVAPVRAQACASDEHLVRDAGDEAVVEAPGAVSGWCRARGGLAHECPPRSGACRADTFPRGAVGQIIAERERYADSGRREGSCPRLRLLAAENS